MKVSFFSILELSGLGLRTSPVFFQNSKSQTGLIFQLRSRKEKMMYEKENMRMNENIIITDVHKTPMRRKKRRNRLVFNSFAEIHEAMRPTTTFEETLQGRESPFRRQLDSPQGGMQGDFFVEDETLKLKALFDRVLQELEEISIAKRKRMNKRRSIRVFMSDTLQQTDMACQACSIQ